MTRHEIRATTPMDPATQRALRRLQREVARFPEDGVDQTLICAVPAHAFRAVELERAYLDGRHALPPPAPVPRESRPTLTAPSRTTRVLLFVAAAGIGTAIGAALEILTR